ncbi:MAG: hypothetical protein U0W24_02300 [Bacteroidales bacterium]
MNNYQKDRLSCLKLIIAEAKKNPLSTSLIPKFESAIAELETLTAGIDALQVNQEKDTTGITADTNQLIDQLIDYMIEISGALQSYAYDKNNNALKEQVNFTESALEHLGKQDIIAAGSLLIEETDKLTVEELTELGISTNDLNELKDLFKKVKQVNQAPQHAIIEKSGYTTKLGQLINEAWLLKKNVLDKLATQFKRKDPGFYYKYQSCSMVIPKKTNKKNGNKPETEKTGIPVK